MKMNVRLAKFEDLPVLLDIYAYARGFMARTGNPTQWPSTYPGEERLRTDIEEGRLYVVEDEEKIRGVFYFVIGPDRTYALIEDGAWHSDREYGTIHRIAGDGTGGVFATALAFCREKADYLRIDTHEDNKVMQHVVTKNGFRRCGIIYTDNGSPRIAFDRLEA